MDVVANFYKIAIFKFGLPMLDYEQERKAINTTKERQKVTKVQGQETGEAPFGRPVAPDVKAMNSGKLASTGSGGPSLHVP
eukprot:3116917-Amphidinium_carterae.1